MLPLGRLYIFFAVMFSACLIKTMEREAPSFNPFPLMAGDPSVFVPHMNESETPLHRAAIEGDVDQVRYLLENGARADARINAPGTEYHADTPLHSAARNGNIDIIIMFLEKKIDIDVTNGNAQTPLHLAALKGHEKLVNFLLRNGARADARTVRGDLPLHYAARCGSIVCAKYFIRYESDIYATNAHAETPLHVAVAHGKKELVEFLLTFKAPINLGDLQGQRPLHLAVMANNEQLVNILLEHGAEVDARTTQAETPVHLAAMLGYGSILQMLLKKAPDNLHVRNLRGQTPLHTATLYQNENCIRLLASLNAGVGEPDGEGLTPLDYAGENHRLVSILLGEEPREPEYFRLERPSAPHRPTYWQSVTQWWSFLVLFFYTLYPHYKAEKKS